MANPTKNPIFHRTLKNLLSAKPKPQADMKLGAKTKAKKVKSPQKADASSKPKSA